MRPRELGSRLIDGQAWVVVSEVPSTLLQLSMDTFFSSGRYRRNDGIELFFKNH
jgi:hypothetical protein